MDKVTKTVHTSPIIMDLFSNIEPSKDNYFDIYPREKDKVYSILYSAISTEKLNGFLSITSRYYDYVFISNKPNVKTYTKDKLKNNYMTEEGIHSEKYKIFFPPNKKSSKDNELFLTLVRPLRDSYNTYGVIEYSKDIVELEKIISLNNKFPPYKIAISDNTGKLLYSNVNTLNQEQFSHIYNVQYLSNKSEYYLDENAEYSIITYSNLNTTNWTIFLIDNINSKKQLIFLQRTVIIIFFISLGIILTFLYFSTATLTKPIRNLKNSISLLSLDKDINLNCSTDHNEIIVLSKAIEDMFNKLYSQKNKIINSRERELQAHFEAMEAQLNPHFLYNTLTAISAYGEANGNKVVTEMCNELANLLRYSINFTNKNTTLSNEIGHIKSYLYIMKMRYLDLIEIKWNLDESLNDIVVPKLILQPIIENCFEHGIANSQPIWKVEVATFKQDGYWYVQVKNNGTRIKEEKIKEIYDKFEKLKSAIGKKNITPDIRKNLGLSNTVMRLYIFYDGKEHFEIKTENDFTVIEIGGPINE